MIRSSLHASARPSARRRGQLPGICAVVALAISCIGGGSTRIVTGVELRAQVVGLDLASVKPRLRAAIEHGEAWEGQTEAQLYVARGEPRLWWTAQVGGSPCRILLHHGTSFETAELAVTTCNGVVVQIAPIKPAIPCWRLAEVGPRIVENLEYFDSRPLVRQWQIVLGILERGQAQRDVLISFGKPYNRGFDEREDGRRAEELAFLDRSGDAYGLNVTAIDDKVVAWKMTAERRLTPEAEQRRLDAIAKKLTDKLAELERLAIKQHAETVELFGEVMAKQDEMLDQLTRPPITLPTSSFGSSRPPTDSSDDRTTAPEPTSTRERQPPAGVTVTRETRPAPDVDPFKERRECLDTCERARDANAKTCSERWSGDGCNDRQCREAAGEASGQCYLEHNPIYVKCKDRCQR